MRTLLLIVLLLGFTGCNPPKPRAPKPLPPAPPMPAERDDTPARQDFSNITQFTPSEVKAPPKNGNFGYVPNKAESREFIRSLNAPSLRQAAPHLFEDGPLQKSTELHHTIESRGPPQTANEPVLLYRALYTVSPGWRSGSQGIGDCVSWGWAHAADVSTAVDKLTGKTDFWRATATEPIYGGSRVEARGRAEGSGGWSDGSYGAAAAKWFTRYGIVSRQPFPEFGYDLSTYDKNRAKQWGNWGCGGQGDNGRLDKVAKERPAGQVALVTNFEEAAAAIESGYPIPVCSMQGFSSRRDSQGFAAPSGSWAHCMCFTAVRYDRPGLLCQNSWGTTWITGPKWPEDQPDGSFWVDKATVNRMLAGEDSYAVANIKGFPRRRLRHELGW